MRYRFEDFELDTDRLELRRAGEPVAMEPQVFDVLALLVRESDRVVSRDEVIEHVWPEKYISEAALNTRLMAARKAVGDSGRDQRLIRTVHGRGYRFVGEVTRAVPTTAPAAQDDTGFAQEIRFCTAGDGTRVAYALSGTGPPLVKAASWLTHLEFDPASPVWGHVWRELSRDFRLVRYDGRGSGLSDRELPSYSFDGWVDDLAAVVDALGLERFPLLGISQGGPVAIAYAARYPERVSRLVLHGAYARGRLHRDARWAERHGALRTLIAQGWGRDDDVFREVFSVTMIPDGTAQQQRWLTDLQRVSATPERAVDFYDTAGSVNVEPLLGGIRVPTLVTHCRDDQRVPFEEGRRIAGLIPGARLVTLESRNHLLLEQEPAWSRFLDEVRAFLAEEAGD